MKNIALALLTSLALGLFALPATAHDDINPASKKVAGPNGGRVLTGTTPSAEFFVTGERRVQITFLNGHGEAVAPAGQSVVVTAGDRAAPTRLTFVASGNTLVSDGTLPAGNLVPTVVQITPAPGATTVTSKFNVNLSTCSECQHAEYACTCEGH
jgi:hypothetical protein